MERQLVPSLLSADFYRLEEELAAVERAGVTHLHLDVMDGQFVQIFPTGRGLLRNCGRIRTCFLIRI